MSTKYLSLILGAISLTAVSLPVPADDTEIFMTQFSGTGASGDRPKVLIIFDNSGSMGGSVPQSKPDYDSDVNWMDRTTYPGAPDWLIPNVIYWDDDQYPISLEREQDQYIPATSNQCNTSLSPLDSTGRYNDFFQVWRSAYRIIGTTQTDVCQCQWSRDGSPWRKSMFDEEGPGAEAACLAEHPGYLRNDYRYYCWQEEDDQMGYINVWQSVEDNDETRETDHLECTADIDSDDPTNPHTDDGWASDDDGPFRDSDVGSPWSTWSDRHDGNLDRTLYTGNYLAWYYNDDLIESRTKIQIARDVVTELVASNPQVDFGLMVFNQNNGDDRNDENGGRVIRHLRSMSEASRNSFVSLVNSLNAGTWTPLCETFYEAYRYIARPDDNAQDVWYGDDDSSRYPYRDACAEQQRDDGTCTRDGTYNSPMGDCENIYVVLMTDGKPTYDLDANSLVKALPEVEGCGRYESDSGQGINENCMPRLAKYMFESDLDDNWENGNQRVITYTIGFITDQTLLSDTAEFGGGTYYTAYNAHELADAFQATLTEILSSNTSFAAPAVAVDAYNRTRSLNAEYIAMFKPDDNPRWSGNLKKLEMEMAGGIEEVVDALGVRAIDPVSGNIKDTATTFWTTLGVDGMEVDEGGAGERLILRNPNDRSLWTNTGNNGAFEDFATDNANLTAELFGTTDATLRAKYINWARGIDVRDEDADNDRSDTRPWIIGDIMHSTPEAINFGNPQDLTAPDVRIVFGTNAGFLHMIESDSGEESWAFFPKEVAPIVPILYKNDQAAEHPYGVDSSPTTLLLDQNSDGNIVSGDGDHAYLFFGLRRGSQSEDGAGGGYYAIDISNPDTPAAMWQVDQDDLPELGQSWSKPTASYVPGHANPVIIIGAGYDTGKDALGVGAADTVGRGIYILDATDGSIVWSITPWADASTNPATNLNEQGLQHCVTAQVTTLDTNGDHVTDRIYFPDTGGNVWRVDLTDDDPANWSIFKLASLGGNTEATDRRFMDRIDVAITRSSGLAYDALMLGSGDRAHPLEREVDNRFFMLRDFDTQSVLHVTNDGDPNTNACESEALNPDLLPCVEIPAAITEDDLYDATANLLQDGTDDQKATAKDALATSATKGWFVTLERTGEKNLSRSITLQGRVFFTTFAPPNPLDANIEHICRPSEGTGFLYAVGLHDATAKYDWGAPFDGTLEKVDRSKSIKDHIPDYPVAYFGEAQIGLVGVGAGTDGSGIERTGMGLSTSAVYWMQEVD